MLGIENAASRIAVCDKGEAFLPTPPHDSFVVVGNCVSPFHWRKGGDCLVVRNNFREIFGYVSDDGIADPFAASCRRCHYIQAIGPEFAPIKDAIPNAFDVTAVEMPTAAGRAGG